MIHLFLLLQDPENKSLLDLLLENVVALTIFFIFASAILGAFLKTRARDRCLKDFHGYHITVEDKSGDAAWGRLNVYSTGFELQYDAEHRDPDGHVESSYIVYESEYSNLYSLYRYHDQLTDKNKKRRISQIKRTYRPSLVRRLARSFRNFFNTLRDAFAKSIETLIGSAKKSSKVMASQGGKVSEMSKGVMAGMGAAYDPILERFIGKRVVVEINRDGKTLEFPGILKEYTTKFIEVLAVRLHGAAAVPLNGEKSPIPNVEVKREGSRITVTNVGKDVVHVVKLVGKKYEQAIGAVAAPGAEVDFTLNQDEISQPRLILSIARDFDMVIPRAHGVVRHGGKKEKVDWKRLLMGSERVEVEKKVGSSLTTGEGASKEISEGEQAGSADQRE